ncbi:YggT family protein [Desulfobaculum bizertense]|uniref:YggT family protein n=1 Tax=Desulfobaculum bizertense DSM 18034 TaxID=1121442 RepID=A0A1T4WWJ9_9BACT|nr:YggT family protein [Desulfobaculum bizertense]UIJ38619.1 YggT family protein [Desulfobaculum bizertense]SKA81255.1 YggT family protein [Desulfobaculum bizertense DSM 18034]
MGPIIQGIVFILLQILFLYKWVVIISALISWVRPDPYNPVVRFLRGATEPVFYRIRRWMPFVYVSGVDLSPIVVLLGIIFLEIVIKGYFPLAMM